MTADLSALERYRPVLVPRSAEDAPAAVRGWRPSEGLALFLLSLGVYLVVATEMLHRRIIFADALAREANAYYVLFSRDPHLPAVGFVWNPLPSLLLLPILPLRHFFPALVRDGFAGNLESAVLMAGTVVLLASCLRKLVLRRAPRLVLVALFALHPMILIYGANGQSEAVLLFFLLLTVNALLGWLRDQRPGQLVTVGLGLGLGYLSRYEAVAPALAVTGLVGGVTAFGGAGNRSRRLRLALNDMALVGLPFAFAFGLWAVSSQVLVKSWFPTFTSDYGNSAQVSGAQRFISEATGTTHLAAVEYAARQLAGVQPFLFVLLIAVAVLAVRRRDRLALAAPVVLGAVLVFNNLAFLAGSSFGWLRFQLAAVPLAVLLAGTLVRLLTTATVDRSPQPGPRRWIRGLAVPMVLLAVAAALPVSVRTLTDHALAREETEAMLATLAPGLANDKDRKYLDIFRTEQQVAADIDAMRLPDSSVLTDLAYAFPTLLASDRLTQFVITSDRDFKQILADPVRGGVRYLLVPEPARAPSDALQRSRPNLYETGAGIARPVRTWSGSAGRGDWRLLELNLRR